MKAEYHILVCYQHGTTWVQLLLQKCQTLLSPTANDLPKSLSLMRFGSATLVVNSTSKQKVEVTGSEDLTPAEKGWEGSSRFLPPFWISCSSK